MTNNSVPLPSDDDVVMLSTEALHFDPDNPRFYRLEDASDIDSIIEEMLDDEGAQDLMHSIGQKGYFKGEPLLVIPHSNGGYIVVEGNRRLAATKLLNGQINPIRKIKSVTSIREEAQHKPTELPCIVYGERKEILRYLGYRHITGVKEWDALSKAKYLAQLRSDFYQKCPVDKQLKELAKDIGSKSNYVGRLLTALTLYEEAEKDKFFNLPITRDDVSFSLITTALSYSNITNWMGLENAEDINAEGLNKTNLKLLLGWMFSKDQQGETILGESRNLQKVAAIVNNDDAVNVLTSKKNLNEAYLYTDGPLHALQQAMENTKSSLSIIWDLVFQGSITRNLEENHLFIAQEIAERAEDIRSHIKRKLRDKEED